MSDALLDRLARANPIPEAALADLNAELRAQTLSLPRVSRGRARRRRLLVVAIALVVTALIAGPALAWRFGIIDFWSAKPAPPHVVREFDSLFREGAPAGMDPRAITSETRRVGEIAGHTLWVAPTKSGGLCYEWRGPMGSGGCDALGTVPLSVTWAGSGTSPSAEPHITSVEGFAHAQWIDEVEVKLDDGSAAHPRLIWISPPIEAGFYFYRVPGGREIKAVVGLNDGEVVAGEAPGSRPGPHPFADLSERHRLAEIQTSAGAATLWTAPTKTEGRCTWLEFRDKELPVMPCLPKGYESQSGAAYGVYLLGEVSILAGQCGYNAVRLIHRDESTRTVPCSDGVLFVKLESADTAGEIAFVDKGNHLIPGSRAPVPQPAAPRE